MVVILLIIIACALLFGAQKTKEGVKSGLNIILIILEVICVIGLISSVISSCS